MTVAEDIAKAKQDSTQRAVEAGRLERLLQLYPDLKRYEGRWKKVAYYSPAVNRVATGVDIRHNCGCCSDSPVEAWPFADTPEGPVYTDPPKFWVGKRDPYEGGEQADEDWDLKMREAGIPEPVIARVGAFLGVSADSSGADGGSDGR